MCENDILLAVLFAVFLSCFLNGLTPFHMADTLFTMLTNNVPSSDTAFQPHLEMR